jgi:nitroreductase
MDSHPKIARPDHDILEVIRNRWSPRAFDPAREVSDGDLRRLFEAARWAPSSMNEQPWRFIVVDRRRHPEEFAAVLRGLTGRNPGWATAAPILVVVAVRLTLEANDAVNSHAWYDTGQAVGYLSLQATDAGLSTRQMQGFDEATVREACDIPLPFEPAVVMAIGYAGEPDRLELETHREAERQPRARRPVTASVFSARWGRGF